MQADHGKIPHHQEQHHKLLVEATKLRREKVEQMAAAMVTTPPQHQRHQSTQPQQQPLEIMGKSNEADSEGDGEDETFNKRQTKQGKRIPHPSQSKKPSQYKSKSNYSSPVLTGDMPPTAASKKPRSTAELQQYLKIISRGGDLTASEVQALQSMGISVTRAPGSGGGRVLKSHSRSQSHEMLYDEAMSPTTVVAADPHYHQMHAIEPPLLFNTNNQKQRLN